MAPSSKLGLERAFNAVYRRSAAACRTDGGFRLGLRHPMMALDCSKGKQKRCDKLLSVSRYSLLDVNIRKPGRSSRLLTARSRDRVDDDHCNHTPGSSFARQAIVSFRKLPMNVQITSAQIYGSEAPQHLHHSSRFITQRHCPARPALFSTILTPAPCQRLLIDLRGSDSAQSRFTCGAAGFCFDAACQREKDVLFVLSLALPLLLAGLSCFFLGKRADDEVGYTLFAARAGQPCADFLRGGKTFKHTKRARSK